MSDTSQGPGWWQASDGKWYPPEQAPAAPPPGPTGPPPGPAPSYGAPGGPPPAFGATPAYGAMSGPPAPGTGPISIGDAFNYGWTKFQQNIGPIIIALLASALLGIVILVLMNVILVGALQNDDGGGLGLLVIGVYALMWFVFYALVQMAVIRGALFITQGKQLDLKEMFATDQIAQYLLAGLVVAIAGSVGFLLCVIPGIIVMFFTQYYGYFLLDKRMGALDAIKASVGFVNKHLGTLIGFYIASYIAFAVGSLLCGIGLILAIPVVLIAQAYMYRRLNGEPVAP